MSEQQDILELRQAQRDAERKLDGYRPTLWERVLLARALIVFWWAMLGQKRSVKIKALVIISRTYKLMQERGLPNNRESFSWAYEEVIRRMR